jgi:hypothetical protein
MTKQTRRITRSTNKSRSIARRLRDEMIFWEAMAQIDREAKLAAIGSYILDIFANE